MNKFILKLILAIFPAVLLSQPIGDSLRQAPSALKGNLLRTYFDKKLNVNNFSGGLNYNYSFADFNLTASEFYNSTIIESSQKNIKDEQNIYLSGEWKALQTLSFGSVFRNYNYSDDRSTAINRAAESIGSVFLKYNPLAAIRISPFAGYISNEQSGELDDGATYGFDFKTGELSFSDFIINSGASYSVEDISPRKDILQMARLSLRNSFSRNFQSNLTAYYSLSKKDFYFRADSLIAQKYDVNQNIQSRGEENYHLQSYFNYISDDNALSMDFRGKVSWRDIDRDTKYRIVQNAGKTTFDNRINEFKLDLSTGAEMKSSFINARVRMSFLEREEKHAPKPVASEPNIFFEEEAENELKKNNTSFLTTLSGSSVLRISESDFLELSFLHRKLVYDTPSTLNFDDRDEVLSNFSLKYRRKISPFFDFDISAEGNLNHVVYIFGERSGNNNFQRVIKLASGGFIHSQHITSFSEVEVSANYTVYDFEHLNPNLRSFMFRQFAFRDTTTVKLSKRIDFRFGGYLKLSEQGNFNWTRFSSTPERYLQEIYFESAFRRSYSVMQFGVGLRYFELSTFRFKSLKEKEKISEYRSLGPLTQFRLSLNERLYLNLSGWYEFINTESNDERELANLTIDLNWKL